MRLGTLDRGATLRRMTFRNAALAVCMAFMAACGGGGGDGATGAQPADGTASLSRENAAPAAQVALSLADAAFSLARDGREYAQTVLRSGESSGSIACELSGRVDWTLSNGDGSTAPKPGSLLRLTSHECLRPGASEPSTGGVIELRFGDAVAASGFSATITLIEGFTYSDAGIGRLAFAGSLHFRYAEDADASELVIDGGGLRITGRVGASSVDEQLTVPSMRRVVDAMQGYVTQSMRYSYESRLFGGRLEVATPTPLVSDLLTWPHEGQIVIAGAGKQIRIEASVASPSVLVPRADLDGALISIADWRQLVTDDFWWPDGVVPRATAEVVGVRGLRVLRAEYTTAGGLPKLAILMSRPVDTTVIGRIEFVRHPDSSHPLDGEPLRADWGPALVASDVAVKGTSVTIAPVAPLAPGRFYGVEVATGTGLRDTQGSPLWRDVHGGTTLMILGGVDVPDTIRARARYVVPEASTPPTSLALSGATSNRSLPAAAPIVAWRWSQVSGPVVRFTQPDAVATEMEFLDGFPLDDAEVVVDLEVRNAAGDIDHDRLTIPLRPLAVTGPVLYARAAPESWIGRGTAVRHDVAPYYTAHVGYGDDRAFRVELLPKTAGFAPAGALGFRMPFGAKLVPGTYTRSDWVSAGIQLEPGTVGLDFQMASSVESSPAEWRIVIYAYETDGAGVVTRLDADFDLQGDRSIGNNAWVYGSVRIDSSRPLRP